MPRERPLLEMWLVDIPDDRGKTHRCRMLTSWNAQQAYGADLTPTEFRELRKAGKRAWTVGGGLLGLVIGGSMVAWNALVARHLTPGWFTWMSPLALIPFAWLIWDLTVLGPRIRPAYAAERRAIALRLGRCAWCLYSLPTTGDGPFTVCPECGGEWRRIQG